MRRLIVPASVLALVAGCGNNGSGKPLPAGSTAPASTPSKSKSTTASTTSSSKTSTTGAVTSGASSKKTVPTTSGTTSSGQTSTTPATSAYFPTNVTRAASYTWQAFYTPTGAAAQSTVSSAIIDPQALDLFLGYATSGRIDAVTSAGVKTELPTIAGNVTNFFLSGGETFAGTGLPATKDAGLVQVRDAKTSSWKVCDNTGMESCVVAAIGTGPLYVFSGEVSGAVRDGKVEAQDPTTGKFTLQTTLKGFFPTAVIAYNNELWVGGRLNGSSGPAMLFHGTGATFTAQTIPLTPATGEIQSVTALGFTDQGLFVGVDGHDSSGNLTTGHLLFLDPTQGLVDVNPTQGDAPSALLPLDGTLYIGTVGGQLLWIDQNGQFNPETGFPAANTTSFLFANGNALTAAINGPSIVYRTANASSTPATGSSSSSSTTSSSNTPASSSFTVSSISPSSGPAAGGTNVTVTGTGFTGCADCQIGGVSLINFTVVSDTTITGTTDVAAGTGPADVDVLDAVGNAATLPGGFTFN
jgi:hypothetical protein